MAARRVFCCVSTVALSLLAATQIGCVGAATNHRTVALVDPPRDQVRAQEATAPITAGDVLQFKLPDDSASTLSATCQVAPDGTIQISGSGRIQVAGKTMAEARKAVCDALAISAALEEAIEIHQSSYYLVSVTSEKTVQKIVHRPVQGTVTVKDALKDSPQMANKIVWIARPMPVPSASLKEQILAVDWEGISHGDKTTNYALQPGDFLFVADEPARGVGRVFGAVTAMFTPAGASNSSNSRGPATTADNKSASVR